MHPAIKRAAPKALLAAIALVSLGGVLWIPTRPGEQALEIVHEREVRELVRELERDLLRNGQLELFDHLVPGETKAWDERADAVRHGLVELMKVERLRFTDVQVVGNRRHESLGSDRRERLCSGRGRASQSAHPIGAPSTREARDRLENH